ncbi:MAG: hypothetical protein JST89_16820 [Cyanobacteria bacterium SZAS-4]|nr:hypothetical protein [Cyanobacteria bacterium SZAS-4]
MFQSRKNLILLAISLFLIGLLIRLPLLQLNGTDDHPVFKLWSYVAATQPTSKIYRLLHDQSVPLSIQNIKGVLNFEVVPAMWKYNTWKSGIDYPPIIPIILGGIGHLYFAVSANFADSNLLNALVKIPSLLADAAVTLLIFRLVEQRYGLRMAVLCSNIFWLNPMTIITGPLFAYQDPLYAAPLIISILLFSYGHYVFGWMGFAITILTKPQGLVIGPALLVFTLARRDLALLVKSLAIAAFVVLLFLLPFFLGGTFINLFANNLINGNEPFISGQNCNGWWIATYLLEVMQRSDGTDLWTALQLQPQINWDDNALKVIHLPRARKLSIIFYFAYISVVLGKWWWMHGRAKADPQSSQATSIHEAAALILYGQSMVLTQAHENHGFGPAALILATWWLEKKNGREDRELLTIGLVLSAIVALNIFTFYGFGPDIQMPAAHNFFWLDFSIVLSIANILTFIWWISRWLRTAKQASISTL